MLLKTWMQKVNEIIPVRWWSKEAGVPVSYLNELKRGSKDNPSLSHLQAIAQAVGHDVYILPKHDHDQHYHLYPYLLELMNAWISIQFARSLWIMEQEEQTRHLLLGDNPLCQETIEDCVKALDVLIFLCNELEYSAMEFILKADKKLQDFEATLHEDTLKEWPFEWETYAMELSKVSDPLLLEWTLETDIRKVLSLMRYLGLETKDVLNGATDAFYPTRYEEAIQRCENPTEVPSTDAGSQATAFNG